MTEPPAIIKPPLSFPKSSQAHIDPYLPPASASPASSPSNPTRRPFLTLTYAQSLDSKISLAPGTQTLLSGPETKSMTHYLRSRHDAILVGVGTAVADNPALNCRLEGIALEGQPRPVVLDPGARWGFSSARSRAEGGAGGGGEAKEVAECLKLAYHGVGRAPWILTSKGEREVDRDAAECLARCGGEYIHLPPSALMPNSGALDWDAVLEELGSRGIRSVMVEGGAKIINSLLQESNNHLVDSVIVTIAPVWLGDGGVTVSPPACHTAHGALRSVARLRDLQWRQYGEDMVMCGRLKR